MKGEYRHNFSMEDELRHENARLTRELADVRHELHLARARQYRAEQKLALKVGDREAWAKATAALAGCCVRIEELEAA